MNEQASTGQILKVQSSAELPKGSHSHPSQAKIAKIGGFAPFQILFPSAICATAGEPVISLRWRSSTLPCDTRHATRDVRHETWAVIDLGHWYRYRTGAWPSTWT